MINEPFDSDETEALLASAQNGDQRAFEKLFDRHRAELHRLIEIRMDARMKNRLDASDVVQETHLESFQRLQDYFHRRPMSFRLWLRKTALQKILLLRRRHVVAQKRSVDREQRPAAADASVTMLVNSLVAASDTPSEQVSRREDHQLIAEAINQMEEADREILLLRTVEGLPHDEIAYLLDIEPATSRQRYARSLLKLRTILSKLGIG